MLDAGWCGEFFFGFSLGLLKEKFVSSELWVWRVYFVGVRRPEI